MRLEGVVWNRGQGWTAPQGSHPADMVLYFAARDAIADGALFAQLRERYPSARLIGCSTGGQIHEDDIDDEALVGVAISLERSSLRFHRVELGDGADSRRHGRDIGAALDGPELAGIFLLSDGLRVNGGELVAGIVDIIGRKAPICGGLAGDGLHFATTIVGADAPPCPGIVAAVGFYGAKLRFGSGNAGGWSIFGPRRAITKSRQNVLYELEGEPALSLYERYLGPEDALNLPGSASLYPLRICNPLNPAEEVVRTVLAVNPLERSMTFAGNMPEGWAAQMMRGSCDRLVAGAGSAGRQARIDFGDGESGLAVMISCIGRRLVMGQSTVDEVEAVCRALGPRYHKLGFYSYGEISPHSSTGASVLHNQTMTLMTLAEAA